jgi:3-oxoacyl-[acyl-carrier protein] reductase
MMTAELQGQAAIVTGGSKGIGYAVAEALARSGANVVICARNGEEVETAARTLNELGEGRVIGQRCDMRSYDDVRNLIARAIDEFDRIDVLVNNAGVGGFAPVDEISTEQWARIIETNLSGVFYACREAVPHMKRLDAAWIINIGSLAGKNPFAGGAAYNASKFGLLGFSEAMMLDVRRHGIRVSCIMPGSVATHFSGHPPTEDEAWKTQPEDIAQIVMDLIAMPERTIPSRIEVRPTHPPSK